MKTSIATLMLCIVLPVLVSADARANPEVEKGVRALAAELQRSFDRRDLNAVTACFGKLEGLLAACRTFLR